MKDALVIATPEILEEKGRYLEATPGKRVDFAVGRDVLGYLRNYSYGSIVSFNVENYVGVLGALIECERKAGTKVIAVLHPNGVPHYLETIADAKIAEEQFEKTGGLRKILSQD